MKKIITFLYWILSLSFILCLSTCSSESKFKDKIFANYYLRYQQPDQQVKAEVHFTKGLDLENATSIKMQNNVFFHGGDMKIKEISKRGTRYSANRESDFSDNYKFSFTPPNQSKITHTLNMNSLNELTANSNINKSNSAQFSWNGKALLENETLVFLFKNEKNKFVSFEINGPTSTASITVPSQQLQKLPEGKGEIYLVRKQSNISEQSNITILSETEFYSQIISVNILP